MKWAFAVARESNAARNVDARRICASWMSYPSFASSSDARWRSVAAAAAATVLVVSYRFGSFVRSLARSFVSVLSLCVGKTPGNGKDCCHHHHHHPPRRRRRGRRRRRRRRRCCRWWWWWPSLVAVSVPLAQARYQAELMMSNAEASGTQPHDDDDDDDGDNNSNNIEPNLGILENASFNICQQGFVLDKKRKQEKRRKCTVLENNTRATNS